MTWDEESDIYEMVHCEGSSTPEEEQQRCPECGGVNIIHKNGNPDTATNRQYTEEWFCDTCRSHFDEPDPPEAETDD